MDYVDSGCYKLNKRLLSMVYLWPYQSSRWTQALRAFIEVIFAYTIFCQLLPYVRTTVTLNFVLQTLPFIVMVCVYALKYTTFLLTLETMGKLIEKVRCDWMAITCNKERMILEHFNNQGRLVGLFIAYVFYGALLCFYAGGFMAEILDVIMPLNESRVRRLPFVAEFFVDQDKYRYPLLLYINITAFLGATTLISTESMLVIMLTHSCGLFKITQYRIGNILFDVPAALCACDQRDQIIRRRIVDAAHMDQRAIEFLDLLKSSIAMPYLALIPPGVLVTTVNLYGLTQALSVTKAIEDAVFFLGMVLAQFVYIFYLYYISQRVTDHNADIFAHLCDSEWYKCSLPLQKLLLLFMQSATRNCTIVIGGVCIASMTGFSSVMQLCFSYFMVIYSRQ